MILQGDALHKLRELDEQSVDLIVTDPPYGYSFMGKDWDRAVPSVEIWQECLRVLKPGAFCFVMSAPRSDVQMHMITNLTEAGFRLDFTPIYWTYASGFPKAGNIGKLVDKRNGRNLDAYKEIGRHIKERREASRYTLKQMNQMFGYVAGCTWWESQNDGNVRLPNLADWLRLIELIGVDEKYTAVVEREEAERAVVGKYKQATTSFAQGRKQELIDVTEAKLPQAKALDGSYAGFQPKPAVEVIIVAMKPLSEKTFVDQALKNGKGITWLDSFEEKQSAGGGGGIGDYKDDVNSASGKYGSEKAPAKNHHPTVKPLKLMSYLITLGSRPGDTVLDPFVGSGTTVVAAQKLGRQGIGIEREAEYTEIARARLAHILPEEPVTQPPMTMDEALHTKVEQLRLI